MAKPEFSAILVCVVVAGVGCSSAGSPDSGTGGAGGTGGTGGGGGGQGALTISDVGPLSTAGANWNDYVSAADTSSPCPESATSYKDCLHGGERLTATVMGAADCTNIQATDELGAFSWSCSAEGGGVTITSTGLLSGKKLSDLLDFDQAAWRPNSVTVTDGVGTASTTSEVWWTNPIAEDDDGGALNDSGTIYIVTTDVAASYSFEADKTALVVKPGSSLLGLDGGGTVVSALNRKNVWFEGFIDAAGDSLGVSLANVDFSRLQGVTVDGADAGAEMDGIELTACQGNVLHEVTGSNNGRYGIHATDSTNNLFSDVTVDGNVRWAFYLETSAANDVTGLLTSNNSNWGIFADQSPNTKLVNIISANNTNWGVFVDKSPNSVLYNVRSYNNENYGIYVSESDNSIAVNLLSANQRNYGIRFIGQNYAVLNATSANNDNDGFYFETSNSVFANPLAVNNDRHGISFAAFSGLGSNTIVNAVLAHNIDSGVFVGSDSNSFTGVLYVGDNGVTDCDIDPTATDPGLVNTTCANQGSSDATLTTGIDLTSAFVGKVTSDDEINGDDQDGTRPYDAPITDWASFENEMRAWGIDGSAFPDDDHDTDCTTGDLCRIWDWSLASSDAAVRDVLPMPDSADTHVHTWSATTESDCAAIVGATWSGGSCTSRFVLNASEVMGDGNGNDNGLCESDEDCLFTPNIGRYQGHGALVETGTTINGGDVQNVVLLEHPTNGR